MYRKAVKSGRLLSKSSRPQNVVYSGVLATLISLILRSSVVKALACYVLIVLLYALAVSYNNVSDLKTDTLNKRTDNPLLGDTLGRSQLNIFSCLCVLCIALLQIVLRQPDTLLLTIGYLALSYVYSDTFFMVKSRGLASTVLLSFCYGSFPVLLGIVQGSSIGLGKTAALAIVCALSMAPLLLAKDYKDYFGDRATNKRTPLVQFGIRRLRKIVTGVSIAAIIAYGTLALHYKVNEILILVSGIVYFFLIRKLHARNGHMPKSYRTMLLLILLIMPLSIVWCGRP